MGTRPPHTCAKCGRVTRGRGNCDACTAARDAGRQSAYSRGYDGRWAAFSREWLSRYPWCGQRQGGQLYAEHSRCTQLGRRERATCTDHIRAMKDGGARLDPANLQSLCKACNAWKAVALEGALRRSGGG
jgi:hypothetical protein